jgi:homoprotocatechuate degradation regulator HpaR
MDKLKATLPHPDELSLFSTQRTLPIALLRAREAVMERFRPLLSAHNVTEQQWRVLRVLNEVEKLDATQLAQRACILAPSLTRMLKTLEARGLISVSRDAADGRRTVIQISETGQELIQSIAPMTADIYREIENDVGAPLLQGILDDLEELLARMKS